MENSLQQNNRKKTTPEQFSVLVKEMEKNPNIERGTPVFGYNKSRMETFWNSLTSRLNSLGPKQRTTSEWKKVWSELKLRTRRKDSLSDLSKEELSSNDHLPSHRGNGAATSTASCSYHVQEASSSKIRANPNTSSPSRAPHSPTKLHYNEGESVDLLRRQVECEEKLVTALQHSNELKVQQLKLMEEQNKLMGATIVGINNLSSKFMEFLKK